MTHLCPICRMVWVCKDEDCDRPQRAECVRCEAGLERDEPRDDDRPRRERK